MDNDTRDKQIDYILNNFDFDKVKTVMEFLDWKWYGKKVTTYMMITVAKELLEHAWSTKCCHGTGGFEAIHGQNEQGDDYLTLEFKLTSSSSEYWGD